MKEFLKKKWVKTILVVVILLVVVRIFFGGKSTQETYRTAEVSRGDIVSTVTGSGTIIASEARNEIAKVSGKVEEIYHMEGERVEKGQAILKLDSSDYEMTIKSQKNAIKQAELNKANLDKQVKNLKITANASGYIGNLSVSEGNYVMTNSMICDISNSKKDEVTLQFVSSAAGRIQVGNYARALLTGSLNYVDGIVSFVGDRITTLSSGATVIDVTVQVIDSKYALSGVYASAEVTTSTGTFKSVNEAMFNSTEAGSVKAETSGTVSKLYVKNGQFVNSGDMILELTNSDLITSAQTTALSLQNMYDQLAYANDKLKDYTISAPIDGVITAQNVKVGDNVSTGMLVSTISNKDELEFKIPVDELDIAKLDYDKKVLVTIDALSETEDTPIEGKISKLPLEGTTTGGVTDYYVTITFQGRDDVRISMNADAEIIVDERNDILYIPVEALEKENGETVVYVVKDGKKEVRKITTGLKSLSYVEVIDGLEEGENVVIPEHDNGFGGLI